MTLLLAVGASHPDVQVDLAHRRALTSGDVAATVQRIREEIALVSAQETWSNRWGEERSIPEYSRVRSGFERLLDDGHADAVVELGGELLDAGGEQVGSSNDDGETGFIHADQRAREQEELERKILEGLDSPAREITPEDWQELRSTLRRKLTSRRRKRW